jgi:hypothetical protein
MKGVKLLASALLALAACDARTQIDSLEGQVVEGAENCNWKPIESGRPDVFEGSQGLVIKEAADVSVDFDAFTLEDENHLEELDGFWTMVSNNPEVADVFSGPNNTIAITARAPGTAVLTLTLVGIVESVDVPIVVVAEKDFEPNPDGAGGQGGGS